MSGIHPVVSDVGRRYLRLHLADNVGPITLGRLLDRFETIDGVLGASTAELGEVEGVGPVRAKALLRARDGAAVEEEIARAVEHDVRILCREDPLYPPQLNQIPDPPIVLYVRGRLEAADAVGLAVVGARRCSYYGMEQTRRFAGGLAGMGFTIVSGLARGIDGQAHQAAVEAGGRTLAVLGNGLAAVYPPEHVDLADQIIASGGALISEMPITAGPEAGNFPRRNRIIVGLSLGVLVVEAGRRSGALISARLANEYNRDVFAIPGRVDADRSAGTNDLLRKGAAKLVTCLEDVLDELGDVGRIMADGGAEASPPAPIPRMTGDEQRVYGAVGDDPLDPDAIGRRCELPASAVAAMLTSMQLKGLIQRLPGDTYVRRRPQQARR